MIAGLRAGAEAEGDDGEAVDKRLASFAVVDEGDLALFVLYKGLGKLRYGVLVGEFAPAALFDCLVRGCLEESAVAPEDVSLGVAGEVGEARGEVDDRVVVLCGVDDDERGSHIDRAKGDFRVGPSRDAGEDIEHVEA